MSEAKSNEMSKFYHSKFDDIPSLSSEAYLQNTKNYLLVDVRSPDEQNVSMIPDAISLREFECNFKEQYQSRIQDGNIIAVTYCTIGYRSGVEGRRLRNVYNLEGKLMNLDGIVCYTHACEKLIMSRSSTNNSTDGSDDHDKGEKTYLVNPKNNQSTRKVHVFGESWNYAANSFEAVYFSKVAMALKGVGVGCRGFFQPLVVCLTRRK